MLMPRLTLNPQPSTLNQVGRLELENMELEQHRIVHESIVKGKDLTIQKLLLQLAVKDKLIARQQRYNSY